MSRQREAIYRAVASTANHPTADWVFQQVRRKIPKLSMGTVYRNLKSLVEEGRLVEVSTVKGPSRYDANTSQHSHFRCTGCERLVDVASQDLEWRPHSDKLNSYSIMECRVELIGLCPDCAETQAVKS